MFAEGHWITLLRQGQAAATALKAGVLRRRQVDSVEKRAERAQALVELGELSSKAGTGGSHMRSWRRHHEGCPYEPRQEATRIEGTASRGTDSTQTRHAILFGSGQVLEVCRQGRKGAVGGPSGMTTEHLKVVLNSARDSEVVADG